jgi:hypothetical protein
MHWMTDILSSNDCMEEKGPGSLPKATLRQSIGIEEIIATERIECEFERLDGFLFVPPGESLDIPR